MTEGTVGSETEVYLEQKMKLIKILPALELHEG